MQESRLTKFANFIKSEGSLLILGITSIIIFSIFVLSLLSRNKVTQQKNQGVPWKNSIIAGQTTKDELEKSLGQPKKIEDQGDRQLYYYPTTNQFRDDKVQISQNTVSLIKEQIIGTEKGKLSDYTNKYGPAETLVYGQHGDFAPGSFWGKYGLLVFANLHDGTIIEIWYFEPTTLDKFLQTNPQLKKSPAEGF